MVELRVDPELLDKAARVAAELREQLRKSAADIDDETYAAVAGLPGWQTRTALEQFRWSWSDDLAKLTTYLTALADGLTGCAMDYRYSDEASAERFDIRGR
ncbi:type VII secretion target [Micromonospora arborensis]|uniref:type VII secretion target n=1 Tax=Micromonospora arborensis TaxID=2116518 RepID=UPI00371323D3